MKHAFLITSISVAKHLVRKDLNGQNDRRWIS